MKKTEKRKFLKACYRAISILAIVKVSTALQLIKDYRIAGFLLLIISVMIYIISYRIELKLGKK